MLKESMREKLLTWATIALCLAASIQMVSRNNYLRSDVVVDNEIEAGLKTWRVWTERVPLPEEPEVKTIPFFAPDVYRILTPALCKIIASTPHPQLTYRGLLLLLIWGSSIMLFVISRNWLTAGGGVRCCCISVRNYSRAPSFIIFRP